MTPLIHPRLNVARMERSEIRGKLRFISITFVTAHLSLSLRHPGMLLAGTQCLSTANLICRQEKRRWVPLKKRRGMTQGLE